MVANRSLVSYPRIDWILASYAFRVVNGHSVGLSYQVEMGRNRLQFLNPVWIALPGFGNKSRLHLTYMLVARH